MGFKTSVRKQWNGKDVKVRGKRVVGLTAYETGLVVEGQAKLLCAVNYGYLAASITTQAVDKGTEPDNPRRYKGRDKAVYGVDPGAPIEMKIAKPQSDMEVLVGTPLEYGCVLGAHVVVPTAAGMRTIGQIRPGEMVLTATGEWRRVESTHRYPVTEKPELVTIRAPWRKGYWHELTVTKDHKIALYRDGRHVWLPASEIVETDQVFRRIKKVHNKGTGRVLVCGWCGQAVTGKQGKKFCSVQCRDKYWADGHSPHVGSKRSDESRGRMSKAAQGRPVNHLASYHRHHGGTKVEKDVEEWLVQRGVRFERQKMIGNHMYVDFWLPDTREVIEADGAYWHRDQATDIKRDVKIMETQGNVKITHLHFYDPRWTPAIDPSPMNNVRYMVVNPAPKSYVEPDEFEPVPVEVKHWTWRPSTTPHASVAPDLYDITVEGVHSFVASGLLISNSYVEFGTVRSNAQPFLRPALDLAKGEELTIGMKNGRMEFKDYL